MLASAIATPHAAMPQPVEGPDASGTPASGAADFLALLGGAKGATKGKAIAAPGAKGISAPANATNVTPPAGAAKSPEAPADTTAENPAIAVKNEGTAGETGRAVVAAKSAVKAAAETKIEGEASKAKLGADMSSAILAALGALGKGKDAAQIEVTPAATDIATAANAAVTMEEPAKPKERAARAVHRRDGAETAKADALAKQETPVPAAKPAKTEGEAAIPAPQQRVAEAAAPATTMAHLTQDPLPQTLALEAQVTEARIPLASREAAQTGISAPILAMRVITKDGVAKSIEIRLDPAELGQVDVKLTTGHDGKLQAVLSAENAEAFELLKKDSGALESALREAGVDLEDGAITFALNDSGADQSHQREAAYGGAGARRDAAAIELAAAAAEAESWRNGVIDISV